MDVAQAILILLFAVGLSRLLSHLISIPVPLIQIALGIILSLNFFKLRIALNPELFFLLFIPPLLFADSWRMPKREFWQYFRPIITLAFGLVLMTTIVGGYFIHWLIPEMSLPICFALAAILSPTDIVAVEALTTATPLPHRLQSILEGEGLINDASGLVAFKFALIAAMTGVFSLKDAALSFSFITAGGIVIGVAVSWLLTCFRHGISRVMGEDPATQVLLLLLTPFAAYMAAEYLNTSGFLAVVAAGIAGSYFMLFKSQMKTRMLSQSLWNMIEFVFNGLIFILLGLQLPQITAHILAKATPGYVWQQGLAILIYIFLITGILMLLRFTWVAISWKYDVWRHKRHGVTVMQPTIRLVAVATLSGVRGAVTLAGALSLPLLMPDGSTFPLRLLFIFIAAGVILVSLIVGCIGLRLLLKNFTDEETQSADELLKARTLLINAAIEAVRMAQPDSVQDEYQDVREEIKARLLNYYQRKLDGIEGVDKVVFSNQLETALKMIALNAEREELKRLRLTNQINDRTLRQLGREIDLIQAALIRI